MKLTSSLIMLVTVLGFSQQVFAVEPSPTKATGIISEEFGFDASNWDNAPASMFSFTLTERIFPTLRISRGNGPITPLVYAPDQIDVRSLIVSDPATGRPMSTDALLNRRIQNNGLIVLHKGKVVHESYRNGFSRAHRHIIMSASKSYCGMLAQIALQKGLFKEDELASKYVPELRNKEAWKDITIRHVMDMRDGTKFVENYEDDNSDIRVQDRATGWRPNGKNDPQGMRDFIKKSENLGKRLHPVGKVFNYASVQTDILALIIQEASGRPYAEFFQEEFWSKLGAEYDASLGTDGHGQPIAQGAISMTLPDFARAALLVMNKGKTHAGEQIINESFYNDLVTPNKMLRDAFPPQYKALISPTGNYRSQFWVLDAKKKQFMMVGVYGQLAYFDYENDFAIVAFGSYPIAKDALLVRSLGTLFETMLSATAPGKNLTPPNINIINLIGR